MNKLEPRFRTYFPYPIMENLIEEDIPEILSDIDSDTCNSLSPKAPLEGTSEYSESDVSGFFEYSDVSSEGRTRTAGYYDIKEGRLSICRYSDTDHSGISVGRSRYSDGQSQVWEDSSDYSGVDTFNGYSTNNTFSDTTVQDDSIAYIEVGSFENSGNSGGSSEYDFAKKFKYRTSSLESFERNELNFTDGSSRTKENGSVDDNDDTENSSSFSDDNEMKNPTKMNGLENDVMKSFCEDVIQKVINTYRNNKVENVGKINKKENFPENIKNNKKNNLRKNENFKSKIPKCNLENYYETRKSIDKRRKTFPGNTTKKNNQNEEEMENIWEIVLEPPEKFRDNIENCKTIFFSIENERDFPTAGKIQENVDCEGKSNFHENSIEKEAKEIRERFSLGLRKNNFQEGNSSEHVQSNTTNFFEKDFGEKLCEKLEEIKLYKNEREKNVINENHNGNDAKDTCNNLKYKNLCLGLNCQNLYDSNEILIEPNENKRSIEESLYKVLDENFHEKLVENSMNVIFKRNSNISPTSSLQENLQQISANADLFQKLEQDVKENSTEKVKENDNFPTKFTENITGKYPAHEKCNENSSGLSEIIKENSTEKIKENSTEKIMENLQEKIKENSSEKIKENPTEKIMENSSEKIMKNSSEKVKENSSEKIEENDFTKIEENISKKIDEKCPENSSNPIIPNNNKKDKKYLYLIIKCDESSNINEIINKTCDDHFINTYTTTNDKKKIVIIPPVVNNNNNNNNNNKELIELKLVVEIIISSGERKIYVTSMSTVTTTVNLNQEENSLRVELISNGAGGAHAQTSSSSSLFTLSKLTNIMYNNDAAVSIPKLLSSSSVASVPFKCDFQILNYLTYPFFKNHLNVQSTTSNHVSSQNVLKSSSQNSSKIHYLTNLKAVQDFSNYFKESLDTDLKLRKGIRDLDLSIEIVKSDEEEISTSFIDEDDVKEEMSFKMVGSKKKKELEEKKQMVDKIDDVKQKPGILKSALKRNNSKKSKKKHKVHFNEGLNKFFEADYVILVRDEILDDEYLACECGNRFCYEESSYYDEEDEDDIVEYEEYYTVQESPRFDFTTAFEPPMEFVDPVTLSPPDGYKDTSSQLQFQSSSSAEKQEKRGTDLQSNNKEKKETILKNQYCQEVKNEVPGCSSVYQNDESHSLDKLSNIENTEKMPDLAYMNQTFGILKGGKNWKNPENETKIDDKNEKAGAVRFENTPPTRFDYETMSEAGDCTVAFQLGNRVVSCNSLKPNSAVRQLFPDPRFVSPSQTISETEGYDDNLGKCEGKYLVTEESLRAFNEVNRKSVFASFRGKEKYPNKDFYEEGFTIHSDDEDIPQNDLLRKTIERNTLRRSLLRYPRNDDKKAGRVRKKPETSLEERIKRLTCNIDEETDVKVELETTATTTASEESTAEPIIMPPRLSPTGEESQPQLPQKTPQNPQQKSSVSSTYKKFTDLFSRKNEPENTSTPYQPVYPVADIVTDSKSPSNILIPKLGPKPNTNDARKQFLSSLAPLTACVTGHTEPNYKNRETLKLKLPGDRGSIASSTLSVGTEYSLSDIDDALSTGLEGKAASQPDVVAGTPGGDINTQDELVAFVQQDAGRIERIKKRYSLAHSVPSDDENDDYGFSRRPSVRGIKPRFGSTTEILQQIQDQLQPPALSCPSKVGSHMTWPYYTPEGSDGCNKSPLPVLHEEGCVNHGTKSLSPVTGNVPSKEKTDGEDTASHTVRHDSNVHTFRLTPVEHVIKSGSSSSVENQGYRTLELPRHGSSGSIFQMKVCPVSHSQVRIPFEAGQVAHQLPIGTTSIIRVGHGQQQTFRVPCPVSGPVQVHLLTTPPQVRSSANFQTHHVVVARATQTTLSNSIPYYQTLTNVRSSPMQSVHILTHHGSPSSSVTSSPTRMKCQSQMPERGIPEGAASSSPALSQDNIPAQTLDQNNKNSSGVSFGMKI